MHIDVQRTLCECEEGSTRLMEGNRKGGQGLYMGM